MEKGSIMLSLTVCLSIASLFYILSLPTWDSAATSVAFNLLIAFIALTSAAWIFFNITDQRSISSGIIFAGFLYYAFIHLGSVILQYRGTVSPIGLTNSENIAIDAIQIALFSIVISIAYFLHDKPIPHNRLLIALITTMVITTIHVIIIEVVFNYLDTLSIAAIGVGSAILAILMSIRHSILMWQDSQSMWPIGNFRLFIFSNLFLVLSSSAFIVALTISPQIWLFGMCLVITSFLCYLIAISSTLLESIGFTQPFTVFIPLGVELFFTIPTLAIVISNSLIPRTTYLDYYLYQLSHIGAGLLSLTMLFLMFFYTKKHTSIFSYTLMLSFGLWSALHFFLAFSKNTVGLLSTGESLIPYIIASLLIILLFMSAILEFRKEKQHESPQWETTMYFLLLIILVSLLFLSDLFGAIIQFLFPNVVGMLLGRPIILTFCTLSVFPFAILQFYTLKKNAGWKNIEFLMVSFLAIWIYPCVLIGVFEDWTPGWWAGQFMFFAGLLIGPALLGYLYLDALEDSEESHSRATLYSDILSHDLSNIIQSLYLHIEIAKLSKRAKTDKELEKAMKVAEQAARIIENVRALRKSEVIGSSTPKQIDILGLIPRALEDAKRETSVHKVKFEFSPQESHCYVLGSELLLTLFTNLFSNSIRYSSGKKQIEVVIDSFHKSNSEYWRVKISDYGRGISPEIKSELFKGHLESADGTGLGLYVAFRIVDLYGGSIEVSDRVKDDHTKGTTFTLLFPKLVVEDS